MGGANGAKLTSGELLDGEFDGVFRKWYANGQVAMEIEMSKEKPDGNSFAWYESGFLKVRALMDHGKVVDRETWKDGESKSWFIDESVSISFTMFGFLRPWGLGWSGRFFCFRGAYLT